MEPDRSSHPADEPRWGGDLYGEPGYGEPGYADDRYAEPGQAPASGPPDLGGRESPLGRHVSGSPHDPTVTWEAPVVESRYHTEAIDRSALRRGPGAPAPSSAPPLASVPPAASATRPASTPPWAPARPPAPHLPPAVPLPASEGIYRARRPAVAVLLGVLAVALALPLGLLLADSLDSPVSVTGVIAAVLALAALPLAALGLYGLGTGAARVPDAPPTHAWLRPPLAYLAVALVLFVAAGLAAA